MQVQQPEQLVFAVIFGALSLLLLGGFVYLLAKGKAPAGHELIQWALWLAAGVLICTQSYIEAFRPAGHYSVRVAAVGWAGTGSAVAAYLINWWAKRKERQETQR